MLALLAPSVAVPWVLVALLFVSAIGNANRLRRSLVERADLAQGFVAREVEHHQALDKIEASAHRALADVEEALVPLVWAWDMGERDPDKYRPFASELRAYLVQAFTELQKALDLDDVQMTDVMVQARERERPRVLPKYPQVPPFLAGPDDIANVAAHTVDEPAPEAGVADVTEATLRRDPVAEAWERTTQEAFDITKRERGPS